MIFLSKSLGPAHQEPLAVVKTAPPAASARAAERPVASSPRKSALKCQKDMSEEFPRLVFSLVNMQKIDIENLMKSVVF